MQEIDAETSCIMHELPQQSTAHAVKHSMFRQSELAVVLQEGKQHGGEVGSKMRGRDLEIHPERRAHNITGSHEYCGFKAS
eukprot:scaffold146576_cov14-Tisochrysis_lutea.AAC.1